MGGIVTYQPFKALYALLAFAFEAARFPWWIIFYLPRFTRPHPQWTHGQAVRMRIVKAFLKHRSIVQTRTRLSLEAGKEKERFVVVQPAAVSSYVGPAVDQKIQPVAIGSTWTPAPLTTQSSGGAEVVLHYHGGAYVIGTGRDDDIGFLAKTLLKHAGVTHVFTPQYRLSSNPGGRFPAALQDAITSYSYLIHDLGIPASKITISGDSAGGNLALTLLRYIAVHGDDVSLPWPGCVWLWSPWVDITAAMDKKNMAANQQYGTDYLVPAFGHWGSWAYCENLDSKNPFISHLGSPFASKSPIFIQTGRAEVLYDDNTEIAKQFKTIESNKVELLVKQNVPHDIILVGPIIGFTKDAADSAKVAGEFLRANRLEKA
jgi:acetyl esterase/lipase